MLFKSLWIELQAILAFNIIFIFLKKGAYAHCRKLLYNMDKPLRPIKILLLENTNYICQSS